MTTACVVAQAGEAGWKYLGHQRNRLCDPLIRTEKKHRQGHESAATADAQCARHQSAEDTDENALVEHRPYLVGAPAPVKVPRVVEFGRGGEL
jgi:hypothetical protein